MSGKVRVGVAGTGGTARGSTAAFAAEQDTELVALADPAPERRERVFEGVDADSVQVFDDFSEMFDKCELDAVCIGLPTWLHYEVSKDALNGGMHVLCEKPPTNTAVEMQELAQIAAEKNLTYMFVRQSRFTPGLQEGRRRVLAGDLGDVYHAQTQWVLSRFRRERRRHHR